jgi:hypothetical protein
MNEIWEMNLRPPCAEPWVAAVMKLVRRQYASRDIKLRRLLTLFSREHYFLFCTDGDGGRVLFHIGREGVSLPDWPSHDAAAVRRLPARVAWAMFSESPSAPMLDANEHTGLKERVLRIESATEGTAWR